ncbi:hypothetical protein V6N11_040110 [Hibiscus sabdariffa]|uniref:Uncharacterized protein n=1 Tax=Hibiscus sabdariffa TaxID=183260 RepID=A0ABR2RGH0_9ROSI
MHIQVQWLPPLNMISQWPFRSIKTISDATREVVHGAEDVRVGLDSAANGRGRDLEEKQVVTKMAAGPSRKGPAH